MNIWPNKCSNLPGSDSSSIKNQLPSTRWQHGFRKCKAQGCPCHDLGRWCLGGWEMMLSKNWLKLQSNTPNFGDIMVLKVYEKYAELEKYMLQYFKFKGPKLGKLGIWPTMVTNCTVRKVFQEVSSIFLGAEKCHNLNISHWEEVEFSALQKGVKFHSPTISHPLTSSVKSTRCWDAPTAKKQKSGKRRALDEDLRIHKNHGKVTKCSQNTKK